jgi:hypothetical protein
MRKPKYRIALGAVALVLLLALAWAWGDRARPGAAAGAGLPVGAAAPAASGAPFPWDSLPATAAAAASAPSAEPLALERAAPLRFKADDKGRLLADAQAGHDIERLAALSTRDQALAQLRRAGQSLPPAAQRELTDLFHHHEQYAAAVANTFVPGQVPADEQEALRQLDTLHRLRVEHFGEDAAASLFGEEEAASRQLLALMRAQNDPALTLQQKAELAQAAWARKQGAAPDRR